MNGYSTRSKAPRGNINATLFQYPNDTQSSQDGRTIITFTKHDYKALQSHRFINDTNISFFMQYHLDTIPDEVKTKVHVFNSFFFAKIKSLKDKKFDGLPSYNCASRWLKDVKIFDKDFLIMPVCEKDHWLLIVVCFPANIPSKNSQAIPDEELREPAILVMNSCTGLAPAIKKTLNQFLRCQWLKERKSQRTFSIQNAKHCGIRLVFPDLPQQKNNYDCGVYVLNYFTCFLKDPHKIYVRMFRNLSMKNWFKDNRIDMSWQRRKMISIVRDQIRLWNDSTKGAQIELRDSSSEEIHIDSDAVIDLVDSNEKQGTKKQIIVIH